MTAILKKIGLGCLMGLLLSCTHSLSHPPLEKPKQPPILIVDDKQIVNPAVIQTYQQALINYIQYLEQYYISIGVYYGGNTSLPKERRYNKLEQCTIMDHIFKDIKLPPPPKSNDKSIDETLNELIEHIVTLRKRIRSNNAYMAMLRERYKDCK